MKLPAPTRKWPMRGRDATPTTITKGSQSVKTCSGWSMRLAQSTSSWLTDSGISPRVHGNTKRLPKHALKLRDVEYIVRFLLSYAEQHALLLPGRVPGYARDDIQRACLDGMSGRITRGQLRRILPSMLLHTQHSSGCGPSSCRRLC